MAYALNDVDPVGNDPESNDLRPAFRTRVRSVG
jgi:hypothetical protein